MSSMPFCTKHRPSRLIALSRVFGILPRALKFGDGLIELPRVEEPLAELEAECRSVGLRSTRFLVVNDEHARRVPA